MEVDIQDAMERLGRGRDLRILLDYISGRRSLYLQSLTITDADNVSQVAKAQGMVQALDEVLRIPEDAAEAKRNR